MLSWETALACDAYMDVGSRVVMQEHLPRATREDLCAELRLSLKLNYD